LEARLARLEDRIESLFVPQRQQKQQQSDSSATIDAATDGNPVAIQSIEERIPRGWVVDTGYIVNNAFVQTIDEYGKQFTVEAIGGWNGQKLPGAVPITCPTGKSLLQQETDSNRFIGATGFGQRLPARAGFMGQMLRDLKPNKLYGIEIQDKATLRRAQYWYCSGPDAFANKTEHSIRANVDEAEVWIPTFPTFIIHNLYPQGNGGLQITVGQWPAKFPEPDHFLFSFVDQNTKQVQSRRVLSTGKSQSLYVINLQDLPPGTYDVSIKLQYASATSDSTEFGVVKID